MHIKNLLDSKQSKKTKAGLLSLAMLAGLTFQAEAQTVYALSGGGLYSFDAANPATTNFAGTISGITAGQTIEGMDFRPLNGMLYALGYDRNTQTAQIYTIDLATAMATPVNVTPISLVLAPAGADRLDVTFDFNPTVDRIRVMSNRDYNYRLNPITGAIAFTDLNLNYAAADINSGANPYIATGAYTNSYVGATATILYDVDAQLKVVAKQDPPNNGTLNTIGALGGAVSKSFSSADVDIFYDALTQTNKTYLTVNSNLEPDRLISIDLTTGAGTLLATTIGGGLYIDDIACFIDRSYPELTGNLMYALNTNNFLLSFDSNNPSVIRKAVPVTGITLNQVIVGMDFRPATGTLYALGYNAGTTESQLYTINVATGAATAVNVTPTMLTLGGNNVGLDFNPVVDKIRVVGANNANYRLNTDGTLFFTDLNLNYGAADVNFGADPMVGAAAYTNSFAGTLTTALYDYDQMLNVISNQNPPNDGALITIGGSGIMQNLTDPTTDMDILYSGGINLAYLSSNTGVSTFDHLYSLDLATGAATDLGSIGNGIAVRNIAATTNPELKIAGGIINTNGKLNVDIFPNPMHDLMTVKFQFKEASLAQVAVFDIFGNNTRIGFAQMVDANASITLDVSPLVPGTYIVKINASGKTVSKSIVKL
jgi:trimeric autotransporter adhesin